MKNKLQFAAIVFALLFILSIQSVDGFSQDKNRRTKAWPDSLTSITLEGTVVIDTTHVNQFMLDVDNDGVGDYFLAFGPDYYTPESGAVRPSEGDYVTIVGNVNPNPTIPVVIVFEINGLLWREPVENWWQHQDWCDSMQVVTETGTVLVDTTYYYFKYYLDVNEDSEPDYQLVFGPPFYEPESGATRPVEGDIVTIEGALKEAKVDTVLDKLVVLKINDLLWRELQGPAPWSGKWVKKENESHARVNCPIDSMSWVEFPPGAMKGGGQAGPQFPDSIYCEFMKVWCDSLPARPDSAMFGWHFNFTGPEGDRIMGQGKAVRFIKRLRMNLSFGECDSSCMMLPKTMGTTYTLKYYDESTGEWIAVEDAIYDNATASFLTEPESLEAFYAVFASVEGTTGIAEENISSVKSFALEQNYPNPFNPTTMIGFVTNNATHVKLSIYNIVGQEVRTLVNEYKSIGQHNILWDGRDNAGQLLPSGYYIYKLKVGNQIQSKQMILMK